jgi:hypothetical protein
MGDHSLYLAGAVQMEEKNRQVQIADFFIV